MTTERSIIMSGQDVQALWQPVDPKLTTRRAINRERVYNGYAFDDPRIASGCPFGRPGSLLWVKEAWALAGWPAGSRYYQAGAPILRAGQLAGWSEEHDKPANLPWQPAYTMPKALARLWLEIVSVRVERVRQISEVDLLRELGVSAPFLVEDQREAYFAYLRQLFRQRWDAAYPQRLKNWLANPWVWVIEVRRRQ